jgi:hypothetical protein
MKRFAAFSALIMLLGGCRAPMPTIDLLAPYGSPRVPPPGTGTYGSPNSYYQGNSPTTSPAVGNGVRATQGAQWKQPSRRSTASLNSEPRDSGIAQTSFESPVSTAPRPGRSVLVGDKPRITNAPTRRSVGSRLRGMPVSDATGEPGRFDAPDDVRVITNVPESISTRSSASRSRNVTTGGSWQSRAY